MYKRRTEDEYQIWANYGYGDGYEEIDCSDNLKDAKINIKLYRENQPQYAYKIIKRRVKIQINE